MLRNIYLHGDLADKFMSHVRLDVNTPAEVVRALCVQVPNFENTIREGSYRCIRGGIDDGIDCDEDMLLLHFGSVQDFHLVPVAAGAKSSSGGIIKAILGVVLIVVGVLTFGTLWLAAGSLLLLGGIAQLISPHPKATTATDQNSNNPTSFNFNGPVNTASQGDVCPLVFGRVRAGSVTVSAGITSERIGNSTYGSAVTPTGNIEYVGNTGPIFF